MNEANRGAGEPLRPPPIGQGMPTGPGERPAGSVSMVKLDDHHPLLHLAIAVVVWIVVQVSIYVLGLGLLILARMYRSTGFRSRDMLLLLVPLVNAYFVWRVLWRFTSKSPYWAPRTDLSTNALFGPANNLLGVAP